MRFARMFLATGLSAAARIKLGDGMRTRDPNLGKGRSRR